MEETREKRIYWKDEERGINIGKAYRMLIEWKSRESE